MIHLTTPCVIWQRYIAPDGYGRAGGGRAAHTVAYEASVGPVPAGLELDHLCRNRACVNALHLEPVTRRENILRSDGFAAVNARKTHCLNGHEFNEANTRIELRAQKRKDGNAWVGPRRVCRLCAAASQAAVRRRRAEARRRS